MRIGVHLGPFWASTSTSSGRKSSGDGSFAKVCLVVLLVAVVVGLLIAYWKWALNVLGGLVVLFLLAGLIRAVEARRGTLPSRSQEQPPESSAGYSDRL